MNRSANPAGCALYLTLISLWVAVGTGLIAFAVGASPAGILRTAAFFAGLCLLVGGVVAAEEEARAESGRGERP